MLSKGGLQIREARVQRERRGGGRKEESVRSRRAWVKGMTSLRGRENHKVHYMMIQRLCRSLLSGRGAGISACLVARSARTRFMKRRSTFCAVFADVSRKSHPNDRASACPSSLDTSRSYVLSHLFPTNTNIGLLRFTRSISCRKTSSRSKVARDAIE